MAEQNLPAGSGRVVAIIPPGVDPSWLAEHDRRERKKAWAEGYHQRGLDTIWGETENPYRKQEPNGMPPRCPERGCVLEAGHEDDRTSGSGIIPGVDHRFIGEEVQ